MALGILGLIAVAFLSALATASHALIIADEQATAESLARSQMEYVKSQDYIDYSVPGHEQYEGITPPGDYVVELTVELPDPAGDGLDNDDGIQKITAVVKYLDKGILTLEGYKVDR